MKKKFTKRLLSWLMAAAMVISMLPISAMASGTDGNVAKIGDTQYATLKAAIDNSEDGDVIELLADATLPTTSFPAGKSITIDGGVEKHTIDGNQAYLNIAGTIVFQNCEMNMHGVPNGHWMYLYMTSKGSLTFKNSIVTIDGTEAADNTTAMYFPEPGDPPADFAVENSTVVIKNCRGNGISWGGNTSPRRNTIKITDSNFTIDNCAEKNTAGGGGIIGTFDITITDSTVRVTNNKSYGSNGSNYDISGSTVEYSNNGTHGLSAGELKIDSSIVTTKNNGAMGITVNSGLTIANGSVVTVTKNASSIAYGYAGMRLYNDCDFTVDSTSKLYINNNYNTGLYVRQGNLKVEEGAVLEIMNNKVSNTLLDGYGGGVYVGYGDNYDPTVVLPSDAKIYNNHSLYGGDDIYVSKGTGKGPSLTFGNVGKGWSLDGKDDGLDCNGESHQIDGWYYDQSGNRWNAEETDRPYYVEAYDFGEEATSTVTGLIGLKAAHGMDPVKKTSYPGLEKFVKDFDDETEWQEDVDVAADQEVQFKLESNVPEDLINYLEPEDPNEPTIVEPAIATFAYTEFPVPEEERGEYILTFHDVMDSELTLDPDSFEVKIGGGDPLVADTDYTVVQKKDQTHKGCTFEIQLDLVELYTTGKITGTDIENATKIIVEYTATLKDTVTNGTFENEAWVTYEGDGESAPDDAFVKTYAINIFKFEQDTEKPLAGAKFELYQKDENDEIISDSVITLTSGDNGYVMQGGLDVGTYYLKEVEALTAMCAVP